MNQKKVEPDIIDVIIGSLYIFVKNCCKHRLWFVVWFDIEPTSMETFFIQLEKQFNRGS